MLLAATDVSILTILQSGSNSAGGRHGREEDTYGREERGGSSDGAWVSFFVVWVLVRRG